MLVERGPGALQQHRVAHLESHFARAEILAAALHREDQQVAALGDHAGEDLAPHQRGARRDHDLGQAGGAVEQRVGHGLLGFFRAEGQVHVVGEAGGGRGFAPQQQRVAFLDRRTRGRPAAGLHTDQAQPRIGIQAQRRGGGADQRRTRTHAQAEGIALEPVLLDQRAGVTREIARHRGAAGVRQQFLAQQHQDHHRAGEQRHAHQRELEEAEVAGAGV